MQYWLVKSDPDTYGWDQLVKDKQTIWDGVHNYQARNFLREMHAGDQVFIYHSQSEKSVVGVARVTGEPYPDPEDAEWTVVHLAAERSLGSPVTLDVIKANSVLRTMPLIRQSRLSVMPLTKAHADELLRLGK